MMRWAAGVPGDALPILGLGVAVARQAAAIVVAGLGRVVIAIVISYNIIQYNII